MVNQRIGRTPVVDNYFKVACNDPQIEDAFFFFDESQSDREKNNSQYQALEAAFRYASVLAPKWPVISVWRMPRFPVPSCKLVALIGASRTTILGFPADKTA